ncbi:MAG: hypothetical protein HYW86_03850 [Candidatus Roizmanbacteria bacterium]|nr:MAG: hypothetical protein HYW86_03850 [Candidatus Roizmanbacteria bacterium]
MAKKSQSNVTAVYYPDIIPDTLTPQIEKLKEQSRQKAYKEKQEEAKKLWQEKQERITKTTDDKYVHTLKTIIEWASIKKRTIPLQCFNFTNMESSLFRAFLDKLKAYGCFDCWTINPYKDAYHTDIVFGNINTQLLNQYLNMNQTIFFKSGEDVVYHNKSFFFKMGDGNIETLDFSGALKWRKIIESFLELRKRTGNNLFTTSEIIKIYQELFDEDIRSSYLGHSVSNIRNKKIKKVLKQRFSIEFMREEKAWLFNLR